MSAFKVSTKVPFLFMALLSITKLFGQFPAAIIEPSKKVFYKDVLNEYTVKTMLDGKFTITTNNGELLLLEGKKYIKPTKPGEIRITIEVNDGNGTVAKFFDYFDCEVLPNPILLAVSNKQDTFELQNTISIKKFKSIQFLTTKNITPSVKAGFKLESFTILIIRKDNKIEIFNAKGYENLQTIVDVKPRDKVAFMNLKIKIEGESESRILENRFIEIVE